MQRVGWGRGGRDPDERGGEDGAGSRPAHSPHGPDFPRYPDDPRLCPWWLGQRSWVDLQARPHLRGARQVLAPMSAPSRGAGSAGSDSRPAAFSGMGPPSSYPCRLCLGTLVARSGSSDQEMPGDDSNYDDDDNKRSEFQWSVFVFQQSLSVFMMFY